MINELTANPESSSPIIDIVISKVTSYLRQFQNEADCAIDDYLCTNSLGRDPDTKEELRLCSPADFIYTADEMGEQITEIIAKHSEGYWYNVAELQAKDDEMFGDADEFEPDTDGSDYYNDDEDEEEG